MDLGLILIGSYLETLTLTFESRLTLDLSDFPAGYVQVLQFGTNICLRLR